MADDAKQAALDFLKGVASGEPVAASTDNPQPEAPEKKQALDFLRSAVTTEPKIAGKPKPTVPQQIAATAAEIPLGLYDMFRTIPGLISQIPSPLDLVGIGRPGETEKYLKEPGRRLMAATGPASPERGFLRDQGILPEDPQWRPEGTLARGVQDAAILGGQLLSGGLLTRGINALGQGAKNVFAGQNAPFFGAKASTEGITPGRDIAASLTGGGAGTIAHSLTPAGSPFGDMPEATAMGVGSVVPYASGWRALPALASRAYNFFKPGAAETGQRLAGMVGKDPATLAQEFRAVNEGPRGMPSDAVPSIPDYAPSPGAITGNKTLLGIERREADKPTPFTDPLNERAQIMPADLRARNEKAVQDEIRASAPAGDPNQAVGEMQGRIERVRDLAARREAMLNEQAATLEGNAKTGQEVVEAQMPGIPAGERTAAKASASQRMFKDTGEAHKENAVSGGKLFDLDPDKTSKIEMYSIRDAMDAVKKDAIETGRTDALPKIMRKPASAEGAPIGDKIDDYLHNWEAVEPNPQFLAAVPYARVKGLRTRLTDLQRDAANGTERHYLGELIKGVDNAVVKSGGDLAERYALARDFWRQNVVAPFREGKVADILQGGKEHSMGDSLFVPGERGGDAIKQLVPQIRANPALYRDVVDYARADMVSYATDINGKVKGDKLKDWVEKHAPVLSHFPELQSEFTRLSGAQRQADMYLKEASDRSPELRALADRGVKNTEDAIKYSAARFFLNNRPEDVMAAVLKLTGGKRREAAEQIMSMLKTREAREGWARTYYDSVTKRALGGEERNEAKGGWANTYTNILDNEADVANLWLTEPVRNRMKGLDKAVYMNSLRTKARANDGSRSPEDFSGPSATDASTSHRIVQGLRSELPSVAAGALAGGIAGSMLPGAGTATGVGVGVAAALGRRVMQARTAAKEAALREIIFNPDLYEKAMSQASLAPAVKKMLAQKIRPYMLIANTEAINADH